MKKKLPNYLHHSPDDSQRPQSAGSTNNLHRSSRFHRTSSSMYLGKVNETNPETCCPSPTRQLRNSGIYFGGFQVSGGPAIHDVCESPTQSFEGVLSDRPTTPTIRAKA